MITACFRRSRASERNFLTQSPANPFGFYESQVVNALNNKIIWQLLYPRGVYHLRKFIYPATHYRTDAFRAVLPRSARKVSLTTGQQSTMESQLAQIPYCLKDPRFSATLKSWLPYLSPDTRSLIVFRVPVANGGQYDAYRQGLQSAPSF